jgi:hypothetical protein
MLYNSWSLHTKGGGKTEDSEHTQITTQISLTKKTNKKQKETTTVLLLWLHQSSSSSHKTSIISSKPS